MKRLLVFLLAIAMLSSTLALAACGDSATSTTASTTTQPTGSTEAPTSSSTPDSNTTPDSSTTPGTQDPVVEATPNLRDSAKKYHVETASYKTTDKNEDYEFILHSDAGVNTNERYCDGGSTIVYMIPLEGMIEPTVTLYLRQQYLVSIIPDLEAYEEDYIEVANFNNIKNDYPSSAFNEEGAYIAGTNDIEITINPYDYQIYDTLYFQISNCNPSTGWGGTISRLDINQYVEGEGPEITVIDNSPGTVNNKQPDMVQVDEIIYTTADDLDEAYIFKNTSSASNTRRYCDGNKYIIYRFDIRDLYEPTIDLYVAQNYKIEISPDGENWIEFANFKTSEDYQTMYQDFQNNPDSVYNFVDSGDLESGNNFTHILIDPYNPGIEGADAITGNLYIRISDCFPSAGWGGAIEIITLKHWVNP